MRLSTIFLLVAKLSFSKGAGFSTAFSYDRWANDGPMFWSELSSTTQCGAPTDEQSPRDVCGAQYAALKLGVQNNWKYRGPLKVFNNGHTIQVNFDQSADPPTTINSLSDQIGRSRNAGDQTYQVAQVHFHWQTYEGYGGSEHFLAGKRYPMESHFVLFNKKYGSLVGAVASGEKDALLVIGIFVKISDKESRFIGSLGNAVAQATRTPSRYEHDTGEFTEFAEAHILPEDAVFSNYAGGLTTPTCNEVVTWVLMERPCTITKATLKKFQDAPVNPIAGRQFRSTADQLVLPHVEHEHRPLALHTGDLTFQITKHNLREYLNAGTRHDPLPSREGRRLDHHGREVTRATIGVFGNDRPLALNKNPIYVNAKGAASSAKCKHSYEEQKAWANTFVHCPTWGKFLAAECNDGDHECRRDPTVDEGRAFCQDYTKPACRADAIAQAYLGKSCPEYSFKVEYPRCSNRCGQPAQTQKATGVKCFAKLTFPEELVWEADAKECAGVQQPDAVERMCPATSSCGFTFDNGDEGDGDLVVVHGRKLRSAHSGR